MRLFCLTALFLFVLASLFPHWFTDQLPRQQNLSRILASANEVHILGCDWLGRDVFARLVYGCRDTLMIGLSTSFFSIAAGLFLGTIVMFAGSFLNRLYQAFLDISQAFPPILGAILLASLLDASQTGVILALFLGSFASVARVLRTYILEIRAKEYILAAESMGASRLRIYTKHVIPNIFDPLVTLFFIQCGNMILAESTLSFLGLGAVDSLSWGNMVYGARQYLFSSISLSLWPASMIAILVLSLNRIRS